MADDKGLIDREIVWERRDYHTGKAGDIVRQLGFAGIALVWLFRLQDSGGLGALPARLRVPAILIVASLAADLLQYVYASAAWGFFGWWKERRIQAKKASEPFLAPRLINWPSNLFFWSKILLMVIAYVLIGRFIGQRVIY